MRRGILICALLLAAPAFAEMQAQSTARAAVDWKIADSAMTRDRIRQLQDLRWKR